MPKTIKNHIRKYKISNNEKKNNNRTIKKKKNYRTIKKRKYNRKNITQSIRKTYSSGINKKKNKYTQRGGDPDDDDPFAAAVNAERAWKAKRKAEEERKKAAAEAAAATEEAEEGKEGKEAAEASSVPEEKKPLPPAATLPAQVEPDNANERFYDNISDKAAAAASEAAAAASEAASTAAAAASEAAEPLTSAASAASEAASEAANNAADTARKTAHSIADTVVEGARKAVKIATAAADSAQGLYRGSPEELKLDGSKDMTKINVKNEVDAVPHDKLVDSVCVIDGLDCNFLKYNALLEKLAGTENTEEIIGAIFELLNAILKKEGVSKEVRVYMIDTVLKEFVESEATGTAPTEETPAAEESEQAEETSEAGAEQAEQAENINKKYPDAKGGAPTPRFNRKMKNLNISYNDNGDIEMESLIEQILEKINSTTETTEEGRAQQAATEAGRAPQTAREEQPAAPPASVTVAQPAAQQAATAAREPSAAAKEAETAAEETRETGVVEQAEEEAARQEAEQAFRPHFIRLKELRRRKSTPSVGRLPTAPTPEELERRGRDLKDRGLIDAAWHAASDISPKPQVKRLDRKKIEEDNADLKNFLKAASKAPRN